MAFLAIAAAAAGFIPVFGPSDGDVGLHMLNGIAAVGLLYLVVILLAFNWQYMRLTVHAAGVAASTLGLDVLPPRVMAQLYATMLLRCLLVGMFFTFTIVYFFPYSGECSTTWEESHLLDLHRLQFHLFF